MVTPGSSTENGGRQTGQDDKAWIARNSSLGLQFALTLGAFTLLGFWLDRKLDWTPWLTLGGAFLGFLGGTIALYRQVFPTEDRNE